MKKHGFDRLRGAAAAAGAIGLGLLGGGSARAATVETPTTVKFTGTNFMATWRSIANQTSILNGDPVSTTGGFIYTGNLSAFGISDASLRATTARFTDFYDSGMNLAVGGTLFVNPNGTVDLTGTTVTSNTMTDIIPGVDAQVEYYFVPNRPLARALYTLTNTTNAPIFTSVLVMGNYGSNEQTTVQATSDGDLDVEDTDLWVVSNDNVNVPGDSVSVPTATLATQGAGAAVTPVGTMKPGTAQPSGNKDNFGYRYVLTIPANDRVGIMLFSEMSPTVDAATTDAADLQSLGAAGVAGVLVGLDNTLPILNYQGRDGEITATTQILPGDDLDITVTDQDLNTRDEVETIVVTVSNDRTPETEDVTLTETGNLTGEFTGLLQTVDDPVPSPGAGTMAVQTGDMLTTSFLSYPNADGANETLEAETEVVEKLSVGIGGGSSGCSLATTGTDRIDPSLPLLLGAAGSLLVLRSRKRSNRRRTGI